MRSPIHLLLLVLAIVLFFLGALPWTPMETWRNRLMCAGLFCWALSTIVTV